MELFGKSWDEGQEVQFNVWGFFSKLLFIYEYIY